MSGQAGSGQAGVSVFAPVSPIARAVQAWFAPVDLLTGQPVAFDPATMGRFDVTAGPAGWLSAGPIDAFSRKDLTVLTEVRSGAPALVKTYAKHTIDAEVSFSFTAWSKLALTLSCGTRQMNLLIEAAGASAGGSGGTAVGGTPVLAGSTATVLNVAAGSVISPGDLVVVDDDYTGQTGAVGAGVAGAVMTSATFAGSDTSYIRRVSLNVARVLSVQAGLITLAQPLPAGAPTATMKVARVVGFVDRAADAFQRQWSALFLVDGVQGDRVLFHYPRLQISTGETESVTTLAAPLQRWRLQGTYKALPVTDSSDGSPVLCFRSYLPAPMRSV